MPIEVLGNSKQTLSNRLVWLGFGLAFGLEMLAGLSYLFPFIPGLKIKSMLYFSDRPWNAMGGVPIYVHPFAIGLGYLMLLDLSFSPWIFSLIWKLQAAVFSATGWCLVRDWSLPFGAVGNTSGKLSAVSLHFVRTMGYIVLL